MNFDPLAPLAALIFKPDAQRVLALALLQADDERLMPAESLSVTAGLLADLGLLQLVSGGYVATDHLRDQVWAAELRARPFPD